MGVITDTRKRLFSDHHHSSEFSSPKKLKLQSQPPIPNSPSEIISPPRRPVHGPQKILRAFGLGSSRRETGLVPKLNIPRMGNLVSRLFESRKEEKKKEKSEGLGLEDYRELVESSECCKLGLGLLNLSAKTMGNVLCRKTGDARTVTESSLRRWKRPPAYKELFESANRRDPKLSSLASEAEFYEKKWLEFGAARREKEDLHELFCPLTKEEEREVSSALHGGSIHELLVTHEASNIEITREVLQCLNRTAWLNDEVINLYLTLLKERERREPKRFLKCHFFNTFFYKKLISGRNGYDYNDVRRWTTQRKLGYSLIECDKIFVPVHQDIHWCLAVINVKDQTFQYLDSLGYMDTTVLKVLAIYFMDEVKDKSGRKIDATSWKQVKVDNLPLQKNGFDCGMFMLKYTDFYSRGLRLCFSQEHMGYFRRRTVKEILRLRAE